MKLKITIDDRSKTLDVPDSTLKEGEGFFVKMDQDMDKGWQMGPEFVENPTQTNRCQIAANKILIAIETNNGNLLNLMAAYILTRMPGTTEVVIDNQGEMLNTEVINNKPHLIQ